MAERGPRGGHGGSPTILGDGTAIGGRGGRGGAPGAGQGGDGPGGVHVSTSPSERVIGGDGGDSGRPARPALGGRSGLDRSLMAPLATATDEYGIYYLGRGGDSHDAYVQHAGRTVSLNVILRLLQIWRDEIIDRVDEFDVPDEQSWWEKACELFLDETARAVEHMRYWEDEVPRGAMPVYPYH